MTIKGKKGIIVVGRNCRGAVTAPTVKIMENKKCGIAAIVGRTNTGKSTLLNKALGRQAAIVSNVPQTTRNIVRGILNEARGQIVFVDTPGIHKPRHRLGKYMNILAEDSARGADVIIHLTDSSEAVGEEERLVVKDISQFKAPIIIALNKIDLGGKYVPEYLRLWEEQKGKTISELSGQLSVVPVSALKGTNIERLLEVLFSCLPEGPLLYPEDMVLDFPDRLLYADIIREKLFQSMRQEVPHSIAVLVEEIVPRSEKLTYIRAVIFVERPSQRGIIIGEKGRVLKNIGSLARGDLEKQLGKKVYLDLEVKVKENWKEDEALLRQMGIIV